MAARSSLSWLNLPGLMFVLAVIALWQSLVAAGVVELNYLPDPLSILSSGGELIESGALGEALRHTIVVTVISSSIAIVVGGVVGVVLGMSSLVRQWTAASVDVLRSIPVVALMPVALLVWGSSVSTEVIVASYAGSWLMIMNTAEGVRQINPRLQDVAQILGMPLGERLRKIVVPSAAASLLVGARLAVVACLIVAIVAEMLISYEGLGYALVRAQNSLNPEQMWVYAITCGILGYLLNQALIRGARAVLPGARELREVA